MSSDVVLRPTLAQALVPSQSLTSDLAWISAGAAFTTLCAQISVPWEPVPFTLQTLGVAVVGLTLGARRGALSQLAYLGAGLCGLPVFASFKAGPQMLLGPTGGYLLAFILAAWLFGKAAEKGLDRKVWLLAPVVFGVNALVVGLGTLWLGALIGLDRAWLLGAAPFLGIEALKAAAVVVGLPLAWQLVPKHNG